MELNMNYLSKIWTLEQISESSGLWRRRSELPQSKPRHFYPELSSALKVTGLKCLLTGFPCQPLILSADQKYPQTERPRSNEFLERST